jgi:hypothetical protein
VLVLMLSCVGVDVPLCLLCLCVVWGYFNIQYQSLPQATPRPPL